MELEEDKQEQETSTEEEILEKQDEEEEEIDEDEDEGLKEILKDKALTLGEKTRFKKVYGKMKAFGRDNESLLGRLQEQDELTTAIIEQNKQLMATLKELHKGVNESSEKSIDAEITATRTALREAIKDGDVDKQAELSEKLIDLGVKKATPKKEEEKEEVDLLKKRAELATARMERAKNTFLTDPKNVDILLDSDNVLIAQAMSAKLAKDTKYTNLPPETFWNDVAVETRKLLNKGGKVKSNLESGNEEKGKNGEDAFAGLTAQQKIIARKSFPALEPEEAYKEYTDGLDMIKKMKRS